MNILRTVSVQVDGKEETVTFGIPNTKEELERMFSLRFEEYARRDYIDSARFPSRLEKDQFDTCKTAYFVAEWRNTFIGTIRLIRTKRLPTEEDFHFKEPAILRKIPRNKRAEFGRFIIVPLDKAAKKFLPRGLVMLVMFDVLLEYCLKHSIEGGYSFIKSTLGKKMSNLNMPVHVIKPYTQVYPENGILHKYFSQANDPVIPVAFRTTDFKLFLERILSNKLIFSIKGKHIKVKHTLYVRMLRLFSRT